MTNTKHDNEQNSPIWRKLCYTTYQGQEVPVYPYVVAVTGHRNFAHPGEVEGLPGFTEETIKNTFRNELSALAKAWNKKSKGYAPLILLTGMADGADQIAAQAALELASLNVKVIAVLPMERTIFEQTIENRQRFNDILEHVSDIYTLPLTIESMGHEDELKNICDETESYRQSQYKALADFLALHSHILFAFWDGIITNFIGGTSSVVKYKIDGNEAIQDISNPLTFSSVGPVVQFFLPRNDSAKQNISTPWDKNLSWKKIPIFYWTREQLWDNSNKQHPKKLVLDRNVMTESRRCRKHVAKLEKIKFVLKRIGLLNQDSVTRAENFTPKRRQELFDDLMCIKSNAPDVEQHRANTKRFIDPDTNIYVEHYVFADYLARLFQKKTYNLLNIYLLLVAVFVFISGLLFMFLDFHQNHWENSILSIALKTSNVLYYILLLVFFDIFFYSKWQNYHYRYHRYRALAEALRIQIFWRLVSMNGCISGFYRSHQIVATEWLRVAENGLDVLIPSPNQSTTPSFSERIELVKSTWIDGQQEFFEKRIMREKHPLKTVFNNIFSYLVFVLAAFGLLLTPWKNWIQDYLYTQLGPTNGISMIFVITAIFSLVMALCVYISFRNKGRMKKIEADRYEREIFPFERASLLLTQSDSMSIEEQQSLLRQLGEEAIEEHSDWLLSVGERDLVLPR